MIGFLRFVGVVNAAVWFGSAIFFTIVAGPTFFTDEFKTMFPPPYNGVAAQFLIQRVFYLHFWCGGIAVLHLILERLYTGRTFERFTTVILAGVIGLSLLGGLVMQPRMKTLHYVKYRGATQEQRDEAGASFAVLHGVSQTMNVIMTAGLLFYLWRVTSLNHPARVPGFRKLTVGWK